MNIDRVEEFQIEHTTRQKIHQLLSDCFPDYPPGKTYFKQLPDFRFLVWEGEELIGHLAAEHRLMNLSGDLIRVFGIADLCVAQSYQHKKIGTQLIKDLEALGKKVQIDFIVLLAKHHELYLKNGFILVDNSCKWVMIHANETLGIVKRKLEQSLLIKPLSGKKWKEGRLDFMGHIF